MTEMTEAYEWRGRDVVDDDGSKIGKLEEVYLDTDSGRPEWAAVNTGLFGTKQSFVPLSEASPSSDKIVVPYSKDQVKDAPSVDPDGELSTDEEQRLYTHYGIASGGSSAEDGDGSEGYDVSGPTTDDAMTRSEEELRVGTTRRERGRARLRMTKDTVTDEETVSEDVRKERIDVDDDRRDV